ncbi:AraC family transcriptional regulator [Streptomyces sp. PA03-6a]|nr:AraC family transcriptional regulator [Streptomyces sp. PA03-6a]
MRPLVRTAALSGYAELSRSLGIDPRTLMRRVGLDVATLALPERWISGAAVAQVLELSAEASGHEHFGLLLAEFRRFRDLGPIGLVVRQEPDVRGVLGVLIRHQRVYNEVLDARLSEADGLATLKVGVRLGVPMEARQATELAVAAYHRTLREVLHPHWQPLSVWFAHPAPADTVTCRRLFGPVVEFDRAFDGILLRADDLDARNATADRPPGYAGGQPQVLAGPRDATVVDRVRELIEVLLPSGRCSIEQVARSLGVDRRTLHRHLARSGETFSSLLNATRMDLARQFVAGPCRSLTEVSRLLGFSSLSAFSRWFHDRFGCSPREWRRCGQDRPPIRSVAGAARSGERTRSV